MRKIILFKLLIFLLFIGHVDFVFSQNTWYLKSTFPGVVRQGASAFSIGTKGYIGNGVDLSYNFYADLYEWNQATNTWTTKTAFPGAGRCGAPGFAIGTKGYIPTGVGLSEYNDLYQWDQSANTWTTRATGPSAREEAVSFTIGTKAYLGTGLTDPSTNYRDLWEWDQTSNVWTQKADVGNGSASLRNAAVGFSVGTKGYIGTGTDGTQVFQDFWQWDQSTNTWIQKADFANGSGVAGAVAFVIDNYPYVLTGAGSSGGNNNVWLYNSTEDTWKQCPSFPGNKRFEACAFSIGHYGYIATGNSLDVTSTLLNDFWEYNSTNNIITGNLPTLSFPCTGATSSVSATVLGTFNSGNVFTAQLSDPSGTWNNPTSIGTLSNTTGGTISLTIPSGLPTGSNYRVRVVSSNPVVTGTDNGLNLVIGGFFTAKTNFGGAARYSGVAFSIGTKGYIGTGGNNVGTYYKDFWEWDQGTNVWTQKADYNHNVYGAVGFSIGTKGYIGTGNDGVNGLVNDFWEWNQATNIWTQKANFSGAARNLAVGFSIGTMGYIGTGVGNLNAKYNDFYEWNQATNIWNQRSNFGGVARYSAVGFSIGTKGYIGTGYDGTNTTKDFWEWDQTSKIWTRKANYPNPSQGSTAFSIGKKGYVGGGTTGSYALTTTNFFVWDQTIDTWTRTGNAPYSAYSGVGFSIGSHGYFGTGYDQTSTPTNYFYEFTDCINGSVAGGVNDPVITTGTISPATYCAGASISIPFTVSGTFPSTNTFVAEISDAAGYFYSSNFILGQIVSTTSGTISGRVPSYLPAGNGYRIRVSALPGPITGSVNSANISVTNGCSSLYFDGVDDRVTIPNNSAYNVGTGAFTVEAWVKFPTSGNGLVEVVSNRAPGAGLTNSFMMMVNSGTQILFQINGINTGSTPAFTSIYDNTCHHIAVTRAGTTLTFYLDGISKGTYTSSQSINTTNPLYIGYDSYDNRTLKGNVNDVRFWNVTRTAAEISSSMSSYVPGNTTGLVGSWELNEGQGQVVYDRSITGNNGTIGTTTSVETLDPIYMNSKCFVPAVTTGLTFDGVDDRVTIPHRSLLDIGTGDFTVEAWFKPISATSGNRPILSNYYNVSGVFSGFDFILALSGTTARIGLTVPTGTNQSSTFIGDYFTLGSSCHYGAIKRLGGVVYIYVDGAYSYGYSGSPSYNLSSPNDMFIGRDGYTGGAFPGNINGVRLWTRALSDQEVAAYSNLNVSPTNSTGLILDFNFNEPADQIVYNWANNYNGYLGTNSTHYDAQDPLRSNVSCYSGDRLGSYGLADEYLYQIDSSAYQTHSGVDAMLYPNPFQTGTNLDLKGDVGTSSDVSIIDINGRLVFREELINNESHSIGATLAPGVYILSVSNAKGETKFFKLIKIK